MVAVQPGPGPELLNLSQGGRPLAGSLQPFQKEMRVSQLAAESRRLCEPKGFIQMPSDKLQCTLHETCLDFVGSRILDDSEHASEPSGHRGERTKTMIWRRERDSNPRYGFPYTHFPGVRLQPLGHPSTGRIVI